MRDRVESSVVVEGELLARVPTHAGRWREPVLIAVMGLPGTGKTALARYLAGRYPLTCLSTDEIRLRHALPSGPATHAVIAAVAGRLLPGRGGVVWDGIHLDRGHRSEVAALAAACGARFELIYAVAPDEVVRERLRQRAAAPERTTADGKFVITPRKLAEVAAWLEPPGPDEPATVVDTGDARVGHGLAELEARLRDLLVP